MNPEAITNIAYTVAAILGSAGICYMPFRNLVTKVAEDIKHHSDASMKKINGTITYMFKDRQCPIYAKQVKFTEDNKIEFRYLEVNQLYADNYGLKREDFLGKTDMELGVPKHVYEKITQRDFQVLNSRKEQIYIDTFPNGHSDIYVKEIYTNDKGEVVGVLGYGIGCLAKGMQKLLPELNDLNSKTGGES